MWRAPHLRTSIHPSKQTPWRPTFWMLALSLFAFVISLGTVIRVNALPAEARLSETWYSYREEMRYDFAATVQQGAIYSGNTVLSGDLLQMRLPVEPPAFRRVLVAKLTDAVLLQFPYTFTADRPGDIRVQYWVDGTLTVPNLWQRPMPLMPVHELSVSGDQLALDKITVTIPIKQILSELDKLTQEMKLSQDTAEIRIRPVVAVEVNGLKQAVQAGLTPEVVVAIRNTGIAIELDEPKTFSDSKEFTETKVLPATVSVLGYVIELDTARQLAVAVLSTFALILGALLLIQWYRSARKDQDLAKLGTALIVARGIDLPPDAIVVDVRTAQQLIAVHLQTGRPVIRVGTFCYLLDGGTCYRLNLDISETA